MPPKKAEKPSGIKKLLNGKEGSTSSLNDVSSPSLASPAPVGEDDKNPFVMVPLKRLRALKKRLTKIEKNEELQAQGTQLDPDQLRSVAQKKEVLDLIKELEEILKSFKDLEVEEEKNQKKLQAKQAAEEAKRIKEIHDQNDVETWELLKYFFVLNTFGDEQVRARFTSGGVDGFNLSEQELSVLDRIDSTLRGSYDSNTGLATASKGFKERAMKLKEGKSETFFESTTYADANKLINRISKSSFFDVELAKRLARERAEREAAEERARREQEEMQKSYEIISVDEVPEASHTSLEQMNGLPGGAPLAFMGESEVLGVQPKLSFDGSPAVVVPIPHGLYGPQAPMIFSSPRGYPPMGMSSMGHVQQSQPVQMQHMPVQMPQVGMHIEAQQPQQAHQPQVFETQASQEAHSSPSAEDEFTEQRRNQQRAQNGQHQQLNRRGGGRQHDKSFSDRPSPSPDRERAQRGSGSFSPRERGGAVGSPRGRGSFRGGSKGGESRSPQTAQAPQQ